MWKYEINWNRKLACKGWSTAAFLHEMIRGAAMGNFVGLDCNFPAKTRLRDFKVGSHGAWPSLDTLLAMETLSATNDVHDISLNGFVADETGRLTWSIVRVGRAGE